MLPGARAYAVTRRINIIKGTLLYQFSKRFPKQMRALVRKINTSLLPDDFDVDTHFNPHYDPWDQRMCMVPDADLFKAISTGKVSVVTDRIARFTESGILLESGAQLEADMIVTATGLNMVPFGKIELCIDGVKVNLNDHLIYKSVMVSGIPNFAFTIGYVNQVWTLKADLVASWVCRLLAHMDRNGHSTVTPVADDPEMPRRPYIDFDAGYIARAMHLFPQQGSHGPWRADQNYKRDRVILGKGAIEDPALRFTSVRTESAVRAG
jgi:monooxygenase